MVKRKGLSSDCKLPPEIVLAIQLEGIEHPCDKCNVNRDECRGYPRKTPGVLGDIKYLSITMTSMDYTEFYGSQSFRVSIRIGGKEFGFEEIYHRDMVTSMFDRLWESAGYKLKQALKERL